MKIELLTEHHLEFLSLKGGCTGLSECTLVKLPHCWKSHVAAQLLSWHVFQCTLSNPFPLHRFKGFTPFKIVMDGKLLYVEDMIEP